jgi:hypothetical protein
LLNALPVRPLLSVLAAVLGAALIATPAATRASPPVRGCDADGDGHADMIVGIPGADGKQAGEIDAGAVLLIPGSPDGPDTESSKILHQDVRAVPDSNEPNDRFGAATACADLDADGYDDVIVGVPGEKVAGRIGAGAIHVAYGSEGGIGARHERWTLAKKALAGQPRTGAAFGSTLATGDFDGDGFADAVIAAPGTATVHVLRGGDRGLTARDRVLSAESIAIGASGYGTALTAGDFNGDGRDDLAIGAPGHEGGGATIMVWGGPNGIKTGRHRTITFDATGIKGAPKPGAALGTALAAADFDGDGKADLAMGAPNYRYEGHDGAGIVLVLYGSHNRKAARDQLVASNTPTTGAGFGRSLATADLAGGAAVDLIVGAPTDDGSAPYAGLVTIHRSHDGFVAAGQIAATGLGAGFGADLAVGDADGDGADDLWAAAPYAASGALPDAGAVVFVPGDGGAAVTIDRRTPGVAGPPQPNEGFGAFDRSMAAPPRPGRFLAIEPREAWGARDPIVSRMDRHEIDEITIHHGGGNGAPNGPAQFRSWQSWHMDGRGWGDIAYHYIVGKDGRVYTARDSRYAGDTGTNYDPATHLLIVVEGNFEVDHPSQVQLDTLTAVVAWAVDEWKVPLDEISGHRDHAATLCPGANLYPFIASGELVDRVDDLLGRGGVWAVPRDR